MQHARKTVSSVVLPFSLLVLVTLAGCPKSEEGPGAGSGNGGASVAGMGGAAGSSGGNGGSGAGDPDAGNEPDVAPRPMRDAGPADPANVRACQLLQMGPFAPVMGQAIFSSDAPPVKIESQAYRIAVPARNETFVTFAVPAIGDYLMFVSAPVTLTLFAIDGEQIVEKNLRSRVMECAEVKSRHLFTLEATGPHVVRLAATAATTVDLVITRPMP